MTSEDLTAAAREGGDVAVAGFTDDDDDRVVDSDGGLRERPNGRPEVSPGGSGRGAADGSTTRPPPEDRELEVGLVTVSVAVVAVGAFEAAAGVCVEAFDCLERCVLSWSWSNDSSKPRLSRTGRMPRKMQDLAHVPRSECVRGRRQGFE